MTDTELYISTISRKDKLIKRLEDDIKIIKSNII